MKQTMLIIANGDVDEALLNRVDLDAVDKIVAADGGAPKALSCGVTPDVVIGDFDSLPNGFQEQHREIKFLHRPSQELNDLEKALRYCRAQGAKKVVLVGVTSGRVDHTINNFSVLAKFADQFQYDIFAPRSQIFIVRDKLQTDARRGQIVSLIPLGRVEGVKTDNLQYPLHYEALGLGEREGASNCALGPFSVSIESGTLLVFVNDDAFAAPAPEITPNA